MKGIRMNIEERIKMVKAMEFIARQVNNEEVFEEWLTCGVADGDIEYGDLSTKDDEYCTVQSYCDDDDWFAGIMDTFLWVMKEARKDGGLYCDRVVSKM